MQEQLRLDILTGKRQPNGKCVVCGLPVCRQNRFLCAEHTNIELTRFIRKLSKDILSTICDHPLYDLAGNRYGIVDDRVD